MFRLQTLIQIKDGYLSAHPAYAMQKAAEIQDPINDTSDVSTNNDVYVTPSKHDEEKRYENVQTMNKEEYI